MGNGIRVGNCVSVQGLHCRVVNILDDGGPEDDYIVRAVPLSPGSKRVTPLVARVSSADRVSDWSKPIGPNTHDEHLEIERAHW